ncbi:ABC transporter domain-containing protein [Phthorimaea operculella]|nr:ABC transporter domain-containing protein [Phthorimaea operculella]
MARDTGSESQETASSSLVEDSLNISFEDLTYTVRQGFRGRKTVLDRLSGTFSAGELTIIMGQSGAGKSSLMDILAGYTAGELTIIMGQSGAGKSSLMDILAGYTGTFSAGELTIIMGQSGAGKSSLMDILAGYTGTFSAGELTIIMGQSGAGKSSLMDILAGYTGTFSAGELTIIMGQSGAGKSSLMDILAGYTGTFSAGELTIIMGQSGAGKSSLMDILAGYTGTFSAGELTIIMGQSGAGKSSLMDILAGYTGTFSAGELTIIMGQSGAGKSSLMDILAGYTGTFSAGELTIIMGQSGAGKSSLMDILAGYTGTFSAGELTIIMGQSGAGKSSLMDILAGYTATFSAGELTIIMGQSGAGKSSLMDILAGYTEHTSGTIYINGRPRNVNSFRKRSCYILQDDFVQDMLTIHESLTIAAELKLGNHISKQQKIKRVEELIKSLDLSKARDTRAGALSGGQKKRLSIALELVTDPPVMFLDEPTSGLDSSISKSMVYLLHLLAQQGRTVVATMHQPSAALLAMVDRLYTVVSGRCAYMGSVPKLIPYLEMELKLTCPAFHNPVDFLIEVCADHANELVLHSQNGKDTQWIVNVENETDSDKTLHRRGSYLRGTTFEEVFLTTLPSPKEDQTNKILLKLKSTYSTSFWKQFTTLTKRSLMCIWRSPELTLMIIGIHCIMALFIGILFYNVGEDAKFGRDSLNCLFFNLLFVMFTAFNGVTVSFPQQIPVIRREHFNRWYMTGAYYCSTLVSSLPTLTFCTLSYGILTYWLTGQPHDFTRFIIYCWTLMLVAYVAQCMGLLNGSMFDVKNGVVFGPLFIMPFVVFSGFFLLYADAPFFVRWMFHVSFLKHGFVLIAIGIFGMDRPKLECHEFICRYKYPKQVLIEYDMVNENIWTAMIVLMFLSVIVNVATYVILKIRLRSKW